MKIGCAILYAINLFNRLRKGKFMMTAIYEDTIT